MSYVKHNFQTGDILYASELNEMDDQIALNESGLSDLNRFITAFYFKNYKIFIFKNEKR